MAKFLLPPGGSSFRLPLDTDLPSLKADIQDAIVNEGALEIRVEMSDDPTKIGSLILNGNALPYVLVVEVETDPVPLA